MLKVWVFALHRDISSQRPEYWVGKTTREFVAVPGRKHSRLLIQGQGLGDGPMGGELALGPWYIHSGHSRNRNPGTLVYTNFAAFPNRCTSEVCWFSHIPGLLWSRFWQGVSSSLRPLLLGWSGRVLEVTAVGQCTVQHLFAEFIRSWEACAWQANHGPLEAISRTLSLN